MKQESAPKFALSEAAGETIRSTAWVALILALVGVSFDGEGRFRWTSPQPGSDAATVAMAEIQPSHALAATPASAPAAPIAAGAQTGAVPDVASTPEPQNLVLARNSCQGDAWLPGPCADDTSGREPSGLPGASRERPRATVSAAR